MGALPIIKNRLKFSNGTKKSDYGTTKNPKKLTKKNWENSVNCSENLVSED